MSHENSVPPQLAWIVELIRAASVAEAQGEYHHASVLLFAASRRAEAVLPSLTKELAAVVLRHSATARSKANALSAAARRHEASMSLSVAAHAIPFDPAPSMTLCRAPAPSYAVTDGVADVVRRMLPTLRLWRDLCDSMQGGEGAFITQDVFMPRAAWLQAGGTSVIRAVEAKIRYLSSVAHDCEHHLTLGGTSRAADADKQTIASLETLISQLHKHREQFSSDVGRGGDVSHRSRVDRTVRELIHKGGLLKSWKSQQDASQCAYISWCVKVLSLLSGGFHRLLMRLSPTALAQMTTSSRSSILGFTFGTTHDSAVTLQRRLSEKMFKVMENLDLLAKFLLQDGEVLLERFMQGMRHACCELVPESA